MDYAALCKVYDAVEKTPSRIEKTKLIADMLKSSGDDLKAVLYLLSGRVFPAHEKKKMGVSVRLVLKALSSISGKSVSSLENDWKNLGDLGLVAEKHMKNKFQRTLATRKLIVNYVFSQLQKLPLVQGSGSVHKKLQILTELLGSASPVESKYIIRTVLEELRIGIAQSTIRDAIIYAFLADEAGIAGYDIVDREKYAFVSSAVQGAYDRTNDFFVVASAARKGIKALKSIRIRAGVPVKVMLGERGRDVEHAIERLKGLVLVQYKYDGFRVEIHKDGDDISIFTRRLEDVSKQFPDIISMARECVSAKKCVLDGEAIGIDPATGNYRPFQDISQRIKREHDIPALADKLPVEVRVFDILMYDDREVLDKPMIERHKLLSGVVLSCKHFAVARTIITDSAAKARAFYDKALQDGVEGVFLKKADSTYKPGVRAGNWIKVKNTMEPLDLVVVAAEWGEGKRSGWLTSFVLACGDEEGNLYEIGKVGSGLKEKPSEGFSYPEITRMLKPLIEYSEGKFVRVKPKVILEVAYEEIQKSSSYSSGFALRFPRILRDRTSERDEPSSINYVELLYKQQFI